MLQVVAALRGEARATSLLPSAGRKPAYTLKKPDTPAAWPSRGSPAPSWTGLSEAPGAPGLRYVRPSRPSLAERAVKQRFLPYDSKVGIAVASGQGNERGARRAVVRRAPRFAVSGSAVQQAIVDPSRADSTVTTYSLGPSAPTRSKAG